MRLLVLLSIAGAMAAQQPGARQPSAPPPSDPQASVDDAFILPPVSVKAVMAPVTVVDHDDQIVSGLTPLDFRLLDNGKPQAFTVDTVMHPISLVVAVQANANVEAILPQIRKIGSVFDDLVIGENGEMAVVAFDHRIQVMTPFTSDPDKIHNAFKNLKPGSYASHLNEAAMESLNML